MRYYSAIIVLATLVAACSKTDDGRIVVHAPGEVDVKTHTDTLSLPKIDLPKIGTKEETLVVKKPVLKRDTKRR
jgi:hypothetical protein